MNIILTGFMGTGKSSVGRRLAKRLGWKFVDVDQVIEAAAGMPITRIFAERGEPVFRRLERRQIGRIIHRDHLVIATGGGAFVDPQSRTRLRAIGPVVCLTAKPQRILERVGHRVHTRPLLQGGASPLARIKTLMSQREKAYARADLVIDTSDRSVEDVVEELWQKLSPYLCRSWQYLVEHMRELSTRYGGKYVVVIENRIVACGDSQLEAYQNATTRLTEKREAGIYYIPLPAESVTALLATHVASASRSRESMVDSP